MSTQKINSTPVVILAGGLGSRLAEETSSRPKPMVEIGGMPIIWHIMKHYSVFGVTEFIICLGYKGYMIKEYFANYALHISDVTIDIKQNSINLVNKGNSDNWKITLIDTGVDTSTYGRLLKIQHVIREKSSFFLTYGDGVSNINIKKLYSHYLKNGDLTSVTAVEPPGRFGNLKISKGKVVTFSEKSKVSTNQFISGGFFVVSTEIFNHYRVESNSWEIDVLPKIAKKGGLNAYMHHGFWQPMDTLRDKNFLENLWQSGNAPWKIW